MHSTRNKSAIALLTISLNLHWHKTSLYTNWITKSLTASKTTVYLFFLLWLPCIFHPFETLAISLTLESCSCYSTSTNSTHFCFCYRELNQESRYNKTFPKVRILNPLGISNWSAVQYICVYISKLAENADFCHPGDFIFHPQGAYTFSRRTQDPAYNLLAWPDQPSYDIHPCARDSSATIS